LVACTSLQPLPERSDKGDNTPRRQAAAMKVGETVRVNPRQGESFDIVVTEVTAERVIGKQDGVSRDLPFTEVASFEQRRFDMLRTSLLILGIVVIGLAQYAKGVAKLSNP
jgi:hypothetical protein